MADRCCRNHRISEARTMIAFEDIISLIRTYQYERAIVALMEALKITRQAAEEQVMAAIQTMKGN
uniref:Uncharacterized protein n=1 Tax=viral metagenome TaxID=1070528 RepID=A0A6H1ZBD8_9ZZZZ